MPTVINMPTVCKYGIKVERNCCKPVGLMTRGQGAIAPVDSLR